MDHAELTLAITLALGSAVALGWLLGAIARRLNARRTSEGSSDALRLATEAAQRAERVEAHLRAQIAEAEAGRDDALALLEIERAAAAELLAAFRNASNR